MSHICRWSAAGVAVALVATLAVACGTGSTITQAHVRWTSAAPSHYRMTWYEHAMVGTTRIVVEVRAGHAVKINPVRDDLKLMPVGDLSVESVFAELERVQNQAARVVASYDAGLGYPTAVRVDVDNHAIDDEYEFGIEALLVL